MFQRARTSVISALIAVALAGCASTQSPAPNLVTRHHVVLLTSTAPAIAGREARIYVREVSLARLDSSPIPVASRVVLFVHGAGTPAEVAFDVPYKDYSWMAYLARAGFDVFSVDTTGYGRSTRPPQMSDACNLLREQQERFVPQLISAPCAPTYPTPLATMTSDWDDIEAVVDFLRAQRKVDKVSLVGWSQGGPRTVGFTARSPEKVARLVLLAPAYTRDSPLAAPNPLPAGNASMNVQSLADFTANWDRQVGCNGQYEPAASASVWEEMIASDPVGANWGAGVRRAPNVPTWGFNKDVVARIQAPSLMVAGVHDKQIAPTRVHDLYDDLGAKDKVFVDLACSSHNALWETNHLLLFKASLEWLKDGAVNGTSAGEVRLGY